MDKLDEIYVFRPGGTPSENGDITDALFGKPGRTRFSPDTAPYPFLSDGSRIADDG